MNHADVEDEAPDKVEVVKERLKTTERLVRGMGSPDFYNERTHALGVTQELLKKGCLIRDIVGLTLQPSSTKVANAAIRNTIDYVNAAGGKRFVDSFPFQNSTNFLAAACCIYVQTIYSPDDNLNYKTNSNRALTLMLHLTNMAEVIDLGQSKRINSKRFFNFILASRAVRQAVMFLLERGKIFDITDDDRYAMTKTLQYFYLISIKSVDPKAAWRKSPLDMQRRMYNAFKQQSRNQIYTDLLITVKPQKIHAKTDFDYAKVCSEKGAPLSYLSLAYKSLDAKQRTNLKKLAQMGYTNTDPKVNETIRKIDEERENLICRLNQISSVYMNKPAFDEEERMALKSMPHEDPIIVDHGNSESSFDQENQEFGDDHVDGNQQDSTNSSSSTPTVTLNTSSSTNPNLDARHLQLPKSPASSNEHNTLIRDMDNSTVQSLDQGNENEENLELKNGSSAASNLSFNDVEEDTEETARTSSTEMVLKEGDLLSKMADGNVGFYFLLSGPPVELPDGTPMDNRVAVVAVDDTDGKQYKLIFDGHESIVQADSILTLKRTIDDSAKEGIDRQMLNNIIDKNNNEALDSREPTGGLQSNGVRAVEAPGRRPKRRSNIPAEAPIESKKGRQDGEPLNEEVIDYTETVLADAVEATDKTRRKKYKPKVPMENVRKSACGTTRKSIASQSADLREVRVKLNRTIDEKKASKHSSGRYKTPKIMLKPSTRRR